MEALMPLITQLIAGAVGGNAAGAALKQGAMSMVARTIVGAIGGVGGGFIVSMLGGEAAATNLIMEALGGLVGGGVLSGVVGAFLGGMKKT